MKSKKYRIVQCKQGSSIWFEAERKHFFRWQPEGIHIVLDHGMSIFKLYQFDTYEEAKQYIADQMPIIKEEDMPIERTIYETF